MHPELEELNALDDPVDRAKRAGELVAEHQTVVTELSRIRREALEELVARGSKPGEIAKALGMTRARVSQLLSTGPRSERAFLGYGTLTVALGGKREGGKEQNKAGKVVTQEDMNSYERLRDLAQTLGLDTRYEVIQPPGFVNLNRDNLVVICGPRLSPLISQVLESDDKLGFERDQQGWYLVDKRAGQIHRSPMDAGEPRDHAYLGRLPRLDGRGTFLYIAGIHAIGAAGVVHFIENNLAELYAEAKTKRFSTLITCTFNPETLEVQSSQQLSPYYREGA
ncbi:hypothetical protein GCM10012275_63530 [Longimycelium tulufanense]|uniref:Sigma-70 family RNA polymerase sigma factor n=1 Tax=Longimycelium tulufanense TaxID=907463 RepID=A0A8J3FYR3_9PSEU|nr:sigma-70 family RNA polymerase sigma factor [Longimycelium tulufanense]GGM84175.1 hypothetical protein GCM10012275_63530 [Longimycelium tulufanense]